jgi:hypothetical protein
MFRGAQQGRGMPRGRQQVVRLPDPGDVGQLVVRGVSNFARRHKVISGSVSLD